MTTWRAWYTGWSGGFAHPDAPAGGAGSASPIVVVVRRGDVDAHGAYLFIRRPYLFPQELRNARNKVRKSWVGSFSRILLDAHFLLDLLNEEVFEQSLIRDAPFYFGEFQFKVHHMSYMKNMTGLGRRVGDVEAFDGDELSGHEPDGVL